jgi:hypothetical protein
MRDDHDGFPLSPIRVSARGLGAGNAQTNVASLAVRGNLAFGSPGIVGLICARSLRHERMMPMQLKHLNLATSDVGGLASFFEQFFGFLRERFSTRAEAAAASPPSIATLRAVS